MGTGDGLTALKRAMVVVAHPDPESLNHALARAVCSALADVKIYCDFFDLHAEGFDPVLTLMEARGRPSVDPLVLRHLESLRQADILAVIHPNCWGAPPAIMKGWMDRVFAPGAAYAFEKGIDAGDAPIGLLQTRVALILNTSNTSQERETGVFGDPLERIWRDCLLSYCGVARTERRVFRVVASSTPVEREGWLRETRRLAIEAAANLA